MRGAKMTKFYVNGNGDYLGGFAGVDIKPSDAIEVPEAPEDARQKWDFNNNSWIPFEKNCRELRRLEYDKQGVSIEEMTHLLWEKAIGADVEADIDALQGKRQAIKTLIPKG